MIASRLMPRSPVWLRKIPSTVSGSQGSRRGFAPAVRFAFPLGAKMYITGFPAAGQGKVRIRAELFRRAGGFRRAVGVFPARAIVTAGALPPILVEEPPQPAFDSLIIQGSTRQKLRLSRRFFRRMGKGAGHFINQAPPRRRRRRLRDRQGGGRIRAGGGFATAS